MPYLLKYLLVLLPASVMLACTDWRYSAPDATKVASPIAEPDELAVVAYYMGDGRDLARYDFDKLTHLIYSFVYLDGNELAFASPESAQAYQRLVALKQDYPHLKVLFALGGWGGCESCSAIFSEKDNRQAFAQSTLDALRHYGGDGLDLDWEYPTIAGHPGHPYGPQDKDNFTALIKELRQNLGDDYLLSFAAGGFEEFLYKSVDWAAIMPLLNNVNLMSYDLVNGFSTVTGHHTALYSTDLQRNSTDHAVQYLLAKGVPAEKIVIGAAFYSRVWEDVSAENNGLYQAGNHVEGLPFAQIPQTYTEANGYRYLWDDTAKAPYAYHSEKRRFATFDDQRSVALKTHYAMDHGLGGIMFWQLPSDGDEHSLLATIHEEKVKWGRQSD